MIKFSLCFFLVINAALTFACAVSSSEILTRHFDRPSESITATIIANFSPKNSSQKPSLIAADKHYQADFSETESENSREELKLYTNSQLDTTRVTHPYSLAKTSNCHICLPITATLANLTRAPPTFV